MYFFKHLLWLKYGTDGRGAKMYVRLDKNFTAGLQEVLKLCGNKANKFKIFRT